MKVLIEEARRQEGEIGGYHPLHNNCENFATGSKQKYASQARAFCHWLKGVGLNCTAESLTSPFAGLFNAGDVSDAVTNVVTDAVIKLKSSAGTYLTFVDIFKVPWLGKGNKRYKIVQHSAITLIRVDIGLK